MGIFDWLRRHERAADSVDAQRTRAAVERIVELNPQLRLASHYQARLAKAADAALDYIRRIVDDLPAARVASAAAWSSDRHIHAFFAAPDDVARAFSRSDALRAFFDAHLAADEAFALLGMSFSERRMLGAQQDGGLVRTDVPRATVSFGDHQIGLCAGTEEALRDELVLRVVDQLVLEGLAQVEADALRRDLLMEERALLKARLQLLERGGLGMKPVLGSDAAVAFGECARVQAQLDDNDRRLAGLGLQTDALERELAVVCDVLAAPASHVTVVSRQLRLDRMNVVVDDDAADGEAVEFRIARIPGNPPRIRAFALVRFARADLLPAATLAEEAAKLLI
jgi:hypothetical protein